MSINQKILGFEQKKFFNLVKIAFHVSRETFLGKKRFEKKIGKIKTVADFDQNLFRSLSQKFSAGCQNYLQSFPRNILWEKNWF